MYSVACLVITQEIDNCTFNYLMQGCLVKSGLHEPVQTLDVGQISKWMFLSFTIYGFNEILDVIITSLLSTP